MSASSTPPQSKPPSGQLTHAPPAHSLQEAQRRSTTTGLASEGAPFQTHLAPRLQAIAGAWIRASLPSLLAVTHVRLSLAEEVLADPEFVESISRELHFRTTAGQFDYKNLIGDYKAHNGRLRKLMLQMQSNQELYIQRALAFEAQAVRGRVVRAWRERD